jgi:hypothetical protein
MHESGALQWREVVDKHHAAMVDEISARLDSEVRDAVTGALAAERTKYGQHVAHACDEARRSHAELLNQALRRIRHATGQQQVLQFLAESCGPLAGKVVVLVFENNQAHSVGMKGIAASFPTLNFEIAAAPAVVAAIETHDPVVAISKPEQLSAPLAKAFRDEDDDEDEPERAYLFPLEARQAVIAMLVACGDVSAAPLELLCGTAAMRIESLLSGEQADVRSAGRAPSPAMARKPEKSSWNELSAEEQRIHLQAQRMARVRVAEMRLYNEEALRQGSGARDIYGALRKPVDAARQEFLHAFLSKSPTMVDYLHLELMRGLANDDDRLLGPEYPGPMV